MMEIGNISIILIMHLLDTHLSKLYLLERKISQGLNIVCLFFFFGKVNLRKSSSLALKP